VIRLIDVPGGSEGR